MSKALFIYYRNKSVPSQVKDRIKTIEKVILPDNLSPKIKDIVIDKGVVSCIMNPVALKQRQGNSICLGIVGDENWWQPNKNNNILDGSYAIFKENERSIELQTDAVGSRSIWYYKDDEKLIASNSQLAIIYFLGNFVFNEKVVPWMLSSGTLGPYLSWDSRIQLLKPQTILSLTKENWTFDVYTEPIVFNDNPEKISFNDNLRKLSNAIDVSVNHLPLNSNLLLPLSGGYDSRGILLALEKNNKKIPTITWGSKKAIKQNESDAFIAKQLADYYELKHDYVHTNNPYLDAKTVIDRFIINSEGRIDHIAGYMDGFKIWNDIFEQDYSAIIRGDEGFGWIPVYSESQARRSVGINLISDYSKLNPLDIDQNISDEIKRNVNESIEEYRDRLYHWFRLPIILGALNETKSSYVEVVNPLLSYSIMKLVRNMPNKLRNDKKLFRSYVEARMPPIDFATKGANIDYKVQLKNKAVVEYFVNVIRGYDYSLVEKSFIENIINNCVVQENKSFREQFKQTVGNYIPAILKSYLKNSVSSLNTLDNNLILFRVFIIYRIHQLINDNIKESFK